MMLGSSAYTCGLRGDLPVLFSTSSQFQNWAVRAANGPISNPNGESFNSNSLEDEPNANVPTTRLLKPRNNKKKGWQWSKGTAPGEYGGPPTHINPRKYWGDVSDPITNRNDFIWNKEWLDLVHVVPAEPPQVQSPKQEQEVGFLSLSRAMALNSLEVDLTQELMEPSKSVLEQQVEAARLGLPTDEAITADKPRWRVISTRREQQQWDRASKAATGGTGILLRNANKSREDPAISAAQSKQQYIQLKQRLQLITLGLGGLGTVSAYMSYSPEVAASFGAGLLGSLAYIRMLGNSVDSYGVKGVQGTVRGALGQPRLLVPVVLVMMYNRWNGILVPDFGFVHLDLIPMLVGFFTYKIATFVQAMQDVLPTFGAKIQS